jgi:hypothetical protein
MPQSVVISSLLTAYLYFDKKTLQPLYKKPVFDEELYDHRGEDLKDFTHREMMNVVTDPKFISTVQYMRRTLLNYLKAEIEYSAAQNILRYDSNPKNDPFPKLPLISTNHHHKQ